MSFIESINGGQPLQAGEVAVITIHGAIVFLGVHFAWRHLTRSDDD